MLAIALGEWQNLALIRLDKQAAGRDYAAGLFYFIFPTGMRLWKVIVKDTE